MLMPRALQEWLYDAMAHVEQDLPAYGPNELPVVLWSLARINGEPDEAFMGRALQQCFGQARALSATGLSMVLWSLSSLRFVPPTAWVAKALVATQVGGAHGFVCPDLLCSSWYGTTVHVYSNEGLPQGPQHHDSPRSNSTALLLASLNTQSTC